MIARASNWSCLLMACAALAVASPAHGKNSGKLPKGAVPLTAEETRALFAGKSINWSKSQVHWAEDGSLVGHYKSGKDEAFGEGKWTVNANEMCEDTNWYGKDKSKPYHEVTCKKLYKFKKVIWTENSKDLDKWQGDVWDGIDKRIKKGDLASKKAEEVKKKFGY